MLFTGTRNLLLALCAGIGVSACLPASAGENGTPASVVARLYRDFAWQALLMTGDQPSDVRRVFGDPIANADRITLARYFSPALVQVLRKDALCRTKTREICRLDFDPIFASQDSAATDLRIAEKSPGVVGVSFRYQGQSQPVELDFSVKRFADNYRITDIIYLNGHKRSLGYILGQKP